MFSTGKIVRMIVEIIKDLRSFFLVVAFLLMGFTLIFYQYEQTTIGESMLETYLLMYAQFEVTDHGFGQIFFFVIATLLLSVILLNMIIAVMNDTFNNVHESHDLTDGKEKVLLILECIVMRIFFRKFRLRRNRQNDKDCHPKYLYFIEEGYKEDQKSQIKAIKDATIAANKQLKENLAMQRQIMKKQLEIEQQIQQQHQVILEEQKNIKQMIASRLEEAEMNIERNIEKRLSTYQTQMKREFSDPSAQIE